MKELKPRIHDESNGLDYVLAGDYYIPALALPPADNRPIGRWGSLHREYLKQHRPALYSELVLSCQLHAVLADLNEQANDRLFEIVGQKAASEGVTEQMKAESPLLWVQSMNSIRSRAEEIILSEMIYC